MRHSEKGMSAHSGENQMGGMDFNNKVQSEQNGQNAEFASEFGFNQNDIKKLKKRLERN